MTIQEAMQQRHSVRSYVDQKIDETAASQLQKKIDACRNTLPSRSIQITYTKYCLSASMMQNRPN